MRPAADTAPSRLLLRGRFATPSLQHSKRKTGLHAPPTALAATRTPDRGAGLSTKRPRSAGEARRRHDGQGREARPTARRAARALLSGKWTAGRRSDERAARPGHVKEAPRCVLSTRSPSKPSPRGAVVTDGLGEDQAFMMTRVRRHNRPHDEPRGAVRHMEGATGGLDGGEGVQTSRRGPRPPPPRNKAVLLGPVLLCLHCFHSGGVLPVSYSGCHLSKGYKVFSKL